MSSKNAITGEQETAETVITETDQENYSDPYTDDDKPVRDQKWFQKLVDRWKKHHSASLQLRYDTGVAINEKIGTPDMRQHRGEEVIVTVCMELGTDKSELSRMRWFAHRIPSLKEFCREHPQIKTWDAVKSWLVDEARKERGEAISTEKPSAVERFNTSLRALAKSLPALDQSDTDEKVELIVELKKFGKKLQNIGVEIVVTEFASAE